MVKFRWIIFVKFEINAALIRLIYVYKNRRKNGVDLLMISNEISEWFYLYNKDIYHFLVYYIGSSDVEDLVQEVFIRAIKGFDTFQKKSSPKTWLFSIARHVGIDEIRKRKRLRMKQMKWLWDEQPNKETPEKILQLNENNRLL